MSARRRSVLVLTAYPDDRVSTRDLRALVFELASCSPVEVHVWFLRCTDYQEPWPESRVVDELRTWWPAAALSAVGLDRIAGLLRGLRLRWWLREVDPDVVVFDDGLGERLVAHAPRPPRRVVRLNREPPMDRTMEPGAAGPVDLLLVDPASTDPEPPTSRRRILGPYFSFRPDVARDGADSTCAATRRSLGLPTDPLVVGWGHEGWMDGPDVFVRTIWALRRSGVDADGAWLGVEEEGLEADRLRSEAERCGISEHVHLRRDASRAARLCGDAVLCCDRSAGRSPEELIEAVVSGCPVVAFSTVDVVDVDVTIVPALDVEAAAAALGSRLAPEAIARRPERRAAAGLRLDICANFTELFALTGGRSG